MTVALRAPRRMLDRYAVSTALLLGALVIVTWPVVMAASGPALSVVAILAHVCGLLAGYGVLVLLVLESRWPPLERGVGSDVLARWHSRGGRVVVGLVVLHAWGAIAAWAQSRGEGLSLAPGRSCSCRRCPPPRWARP